MECSLVLTGVPVFSGVTNRILDLVRRSEGTGTAQDPLDVGGSVHRVAYPEDSKYRDRVGVVHT